MDVDGDDIWGDGDEAGSGGNDGQHLDREWRARREEHFSSGYREGLEAGKHETVQEGFDSGYAQGAAAGFECGAARGAAATLRALAPRLPGLADRLQDVQQQEAAGSQQKQLADMPYQQLQRRVCEVLMAAGANNSGEQAAAHPGMEQQPAAPTLPPDVVAALQAHRSTLELLGLQGPAQ